MAERLHPSLVFTALSSAEAADPALYADLLDLWVAVVDTGGAVGFTAPPDREAVARTLRGQLKRVREGRDALGVLRHDGATWRSAPTRPPSGSRRATIATRSSCC